MNTMHVRKIAARCCFALLLAIATAPVIHAEEPIRAMAFFEEPLLLKAVPGKQRHLLVVLPQPGITAPVYALKGMLRYEDVEGEAYLQMNNDFGERGIFFTKGLAESGPLQKIAGSSDWRPFVLPFYASQGNEAGGESLIPREITLSLHLPGEGSVSMRDIRLYQYASDEDPLRAAGQLVSAPNAGYSIGIIIIFAVLALAALAAIIARSRGGQ